jgi:hypothetical protein
MKTLSLVVHELLKDKVLVSRESARLLEEPLSRLMTDAGRGATRPDDGDVTVDFAGVEGIAPSFLDELFTIFECLVSAAGAATSRRLRVANPPARLSSKFEAVARGHRLSVATQPDGAWLLAPLDSPT